MPLLEQKQGPDWCPNAAMVGAVVEGSVSETLSRAVANHMARCPACANLHERLRSFDRTDGPRQGPEWTRAERRLDSWLDSFLVSEAVVHRVGGQVRQSDLRLRWQRLTEPVRALRARWLLVPAAALALVIFSFLGGRVSIREVPQPIAEAVPPKGAITDAATPGSHIAPQAHPRRPKRSLIASGGHRIAESETQPLASQQRETGEVAAKNAPASTSHDAPQTAEATPMAATLSASARSDRAIPAAHAPSALGARSEVTSRSGGTSVAGAKTQQSRAINAPAEIRLEAGTRVWISVKSVRQRADGVSDFSGSVLLPVTQSGAVLLERSTQISGVVGVRQGKTTVKITELVSNGARYRLKGTGESASAPPGMGVAVKFNAGQVLETWISSASIFGKLPDEIGAPEK